MARLICWVLPATVRAAAAFAFGVAASDTAIAGHDVAAFLQLGVVRERQDTEKGDGLSSFLDAIALGAEADGQTGAANMLKTFSQLMPQMGGQGGDTTEAGTGRSDDPLAGLHALSESLNVLKKDNKTDMNAKIMNNLGVFFKKAISGGAQKADIKQEGAASTANSGSQKPDLFGGFLKRLARGGQEGAQMPEGMDDVMKALDNPHKDEIPVEATTALIKMVSNQIKAQKGVPRRLTQQQLERKNQTRQLNQDVKKVLKATADNIWKKNMDAFSGISALWKDNSPRGTFGLKRNATEAMNEVGKSTDGFAVQRREDKAQEAKLEASPLSAHSQSQMQGREQPKEEQAVQMPQQAQVQQKQLEVQMAKEPMPQSAARLQQQQQLVTNAPMAWAPTVQQPGMPSPAWSVRQPQPQAWGHQPVAWQLMSPIQSMGFMGRPPMMQEQPIVPTQNQMPAQMMQQPAIAPVRQQPPMVNYPQGIQQQLPMGYYTQAMQQSTGWPAAGYGMMSQAGSQQQR